MSKLELIRALYDYNEYANDRVLEAAARLSGERFAEKQGASFGCWSRMMTRRSGYLSATC